MRRDPNRSADIIEGEKTVTKIVTLLFGAFLFFFWALPEIGHRFLVWDDYYGMKNTEIFTSKTVNCGNETDTKGGRFLGIYPYRAIIMKGCLWDPVKQVNYSVFIDIDVRKPYFFSLADILDRSELVVASYENIFYKVYPISSFKQK